MKKSTVGFNKIMKTAFSSFLNFESFIGELFFKKIKLKKFLIFNILY